MQLIRPMIDLAMNPLLFGKAFSREHTQDKMESHLNISKHFDIHALDLFCHLAKYPIGEETGNSRLAEVYGT